MKIMLTSFGVSSQGGSAPENAVFYRMPPIDMRFSESNFTPDYAILFLCDTLVIDKTTLEFLCSESWPPANANCFHNISETIKALNAEGFLEVRDFDEIVADKRELITKMTEWDVRNLDSWVEPLRQSWEAWRRFAKYASTLVGQDQQYVSATTALGYSVPLHSLFKGRSNARDLFEGALATARNRRKAEYRHVLKETLTEYLSYVNANIVLSNEVGAGFHDWADFHPFYSKKFLAIGQETVGVPESAQSVRQLLDIFCPDIAFIDPGRLVDCLKDPRIADLRRLANDAVAGSVQFDNEYANRILREVLGIEKKAASYRRLLSYVFIPLGLVPAVGTLLQKCLEDISGSFVDQRLRKDHQWFYFLTDVAAEASTRTQP